MKKRIKSIVLGLVALLIVIQFFQIDKTNPTYNAANDLISIEQPPAEVADILKHACYDCHAYETKYPWYTYVQPVGWWIKNHISEGQHHLNFSKWGEYSDKRKDRKLKETVDEVKEGEMPMNSYTWVHADARLTETQRDALITWFKETRIKLNYVDPEGGVQQKEGELQEGGEAHEHE